MMPIEIEQLGDPAVPFPLDSALYAWALQHERLAAWTAKVAEHLPPEGTDERIAVLSAAVERMEGGAFAIDLRYAVRGWIEREKIIKRRLAARRGSP
jgi:hypothetical protein